MTSTDSDASDRVKSYVTVDFNPLILAGSAAYLNSYESFHRVVEFDENVDVGVNLCRYETNGKHI